MGVYKRGKLFWIRFQFRGEEIREPARTTSRAEAKAFEKRRREELRRAYRDGKPRFTFDDMMNRFIDDHLPGLKPKAAKRYTTSLRALRPHFTGCLLHEITKGRISEYVSERRKAVSAASVRRDLACLSVAMSSATDWEWIEHNPLKDYSRRSLPEATPRTRVLTQDEREKVLAKATVAKGVIKAAWLTGMRSGEICALRRKDVDFENGDILVRDSKNRRPRIVTLDAEGLAHFRAQKTATDVPYMFWWGPGLPYTVEQVSRAFNRAAKRAKVANARFHDLRHSFASDRISRGMDLYTLGKLLGHSTANQTGKYAHLQTQTMRDAMKKTERPAGTIPAQDATDSDGPKE
jgi:integrase